MWSLFLLQKYLEMQLDIEKLYWNILEKIFPFFSFFNFFCIVKTKNRTKRDPSRLYIVGVRRKEIVFNQILLTKNERLSSDIMHKL